MLTDEKPNHAIDAHVIDVSPEFDGKAGTTDDREAMRRLGKKQLFKRNFGPISLFGFSLILVSTWQGLLSTAALALGNGGPSGLLYTYLVCYLGFTMVVASMAEMASMAPTSGGQYHWVSEFAPRNLQKLLSYLVGWLAVLGYQVGVTISAFLAGLMIQGLVILNNPSYTPERWHGTLIAICLTVCAALTNIFLASLLPWIEIMILFLNISGWLVVLVTLWVLGPHNSNEGVWDTFIDAGWGNTGLASLIGLITSAGSFAGIDAAAHMAEELKNAPKTLPRAMLWTAITNGGMGLIMLITFLYTMGDPAVALASPTGFPIIEVFRGVTGHNSGGTALTSILIALGFLGHLTNMAGSSRQMFAFARDRGLPASRWISRVSPRFDVPVNAILISSTIACILYCINIGSTIAFNIILSVGAVSLLTSYFTSVGCIAWRRLRGLPLLETRFSLGKAGLMVNLFSLAFLALVFVMSFFPPIPNPPPSAMNWAVAVYGGVLIFAGIFYLVKARRHYVGPVEYVRKSS